MNGNPGTDPATVEYQALGDRAVIAISGELDMDGAADVAAAIQRALDGPTRRVEIDVGDLTFIDSAGLQSLLEARAVLQGANVAFDLSAVSPAVERVIDLTCLREILLPGAG